MTVETRKISRADARRNRERVLAAAELEFASGGIAVTLEQIATRARVGTGTVYRHFPTKDALYAAVVDRRIKHLADRARRANARPEPAAAFYDFLIYLMEHALLNKSLCDAVSTQGDWRISMDPTAECDFHTSLTELLTKAQQVNAVRGDLSADEVMALVPGYVAMVRYLGPGRSIEGVTSVLWDGLRPEFDNGRPPHVKRNVVMKRNETEVIADRNETIDRARSCAVCGSKIETAGTGRPAKYCGPACRLRAHRARGSRP
jgi:AcrR family transcriptional regulator